jgi:ubiquinone/menaquinone biosynthesis C-methylase UbiE
MYSIADYGAFLSDEVRTGAYAGALRQAVTPGAVVIDIGTGTGIFALLACRFGARRVYAIEPDDAIQVAREIAAANGCADRIEFIQAMSTRVTLPERANVIISDMSGVLPWFEQHIPSIADARRRFLAPGGTMIPQRDSSWAAVVEMRDSYARQTGPWDDNRFRLDMDAARRIVINTWKTARVARENLLTEPQRWATIDYTVVEDPDVRAQVTWTVTRSGTGHGLAAGFDRMLSDAFCLSNAPDAPDAIRPLHTYGTGFFPWPVPVTLAAGDVVTVDLEARLIRRDYTWTWKTRVLDRGQSGADKANFTQSTFLGAPLSPATLQKRAAGYIPALSEDGRIARFILESMDDGVSLGEIARLLSTEFSVRFPRPKDALSHVADLSQQYG